MHRTTELVASHHVAKCEEDAAEQNDSEKKSYKMPAFQNAVTAVLSSYRHALLFFRRSIVHPLGDDVDRQRKHDGRVFFDADFGQRLQIAKLDRSGFAFEHAGGFCEFR